MPAPRIRLGLAGVVLVAASLISISPPAAAAPAWAPYATAPIHPGVQTFTNGSQCTANFVFYAGTTVYIGQAAHCASTGLPNQTNGCSSPTLPVGTAVQVGGASAAGTMVYSSWVTMQALGESDPDTCQYNDFALIRLNGGDGAKVNPSIPHWGGPVGLGAGTKPLGRVYSYGNSELRGGVTLLSPKTGFSLGDTNNGWTRLVFTVTPGIPGDSGSAFMNSAGYAVGVLSTLSGGVFNGVGNLKPELQYMQTHGGPGVTLAKGTKKFAPNALPLGGK